MTAKFIKGLRTNRMTNISGSQPSRMMMKIIYEFWGFCVNGTDNLASPGGFATAGISFPTAFTSSFTLLASGNDGSTTYQSDNFYSPSANFTNIHNSLTASSNGIVNKHIVLWKSSSTSRDDSIYRIIGLENSSTLKLETFTGGTTTTGSQAALSTRNSVNYRIIDLDAAARIMSGWSNTHGMVLQLSCSTVNPGQANAHVFVQLISGSFNGNVDMQLVVSPSGTWNGTTFTDTSGSTRIQVARSADTTGAGIIYAIADKDFLFFQSAGESGAWLSSSFGFHVETPIRLLPALFDPNPIVWNMWHSGSTATTITGFNNAFKMIDWDGVARTWTTLTRSPFGEWIQPSIVPLSGGIWHALSSSNIKYWNTNFDSYDMMYAASDGLLHQSSSGSYSFARCRLKNLMFTLKTTPVGQRFGRNWVHAGNGILIPWDNSEQPFNLFYGSNFVL